MSVKEKRTAQHRHCAVCTLWRREKQAKPLPRRVRTWANYWPDVALSTNAAWSDFIFFRLSIGR